MAGPGDVYLARFPFGGRTGSKLRPVLLLTGPEGSVPEYLVGYMRLATIHQSDLARFLGSISSTLKNDVDTKLRTLLNL